MSYDGNKSPEELDQAPSVVDASLFLVGVGHMLYKATRAELGLVDTAELTAALDTKASLVHSHSTSDITGFSAAVDSIADIAASDAIATHVGSSDPHTQYQKESEKGAANGYAPLGADSKVDSAYLPAIPTQYTNEMAQDAIGAMIDGSLVYVDSTPLLTRAALTGAIIAAQGSNATELGSFTKAQLNAAVSDGDILYAGDVSTYSDEQAQDAVGGILADSAEINFTYTDATPSITASIVAASIDESKLDASVNASLDLADSALQPTDIASGTITPRADDINLAGGSTGYVLTVQADGSLALQAPTGGSGAVDSVNGQTGVVVLDTSDIAATTDKNYVTDAHLTALGSLASDLAGKEATANKGVAGGYASLDGGGKIPSSQMPAVAITSSFVVASQVAQLALTVQEGDVAIRTDLNKSYIHNGGVTGTMADWYELLTPTDTVLSVNGETGSVTLTTDDISDSGQTNKWVTAGEKADIALISSKADDSAVVHLTGAESITGNKTIVDGLFDNAGTPIISVGVTQRSLYYSDGSSALDWNSAILRNPSGAIALNWDNRHLVDSGGAIVLEWQARQLIAPDNTYVLDWASGVVLLRDLVAGFNGGLDVSTLTADRTYTLPDQSGTVALLSDIPSIAGLFVIASDDSDDITEGATHLFLTSAERTILSNTSGVNSGDQDLSPYFNKSLDDTDDIVEGATNLFATSAEKTKLSFITVTQAVDLDALESDILGKADAGANSDITSLSAITGEIRLDGLPNSDDSFSGPSTNSFNAGETIAQWDLVYMDSAGKWMKADASVAATSAGMLAMACEAGTTDNPLLVALPGAFIRNDAWALTVGAILYADITAGQVTETAPSATDEVIRVTGWAVSADVIFFNPESGYITHT